jgi:hypothetical protein
VWFVRRKRRFGVLLGLWIGLGFFLLVAFPPQVPAGAMWIILPLALLGGVTVEAVMSGWRSIRGWRAEWVYGFITGALWVYLYLRFSSYGLKGDPLDLVVGIIASVSPLLLLALAALVFALISGDDRVVAAEIIRGARSALRGVIVSTGIVLLAATFSVGWGVMQVRPADPRELLVYEPTAPDVRDLVQALRDLSWRETGLPTTLEFTYEAQPDSVLTWYLRDFTAARRVDSLQGLEVGEQGTVIVTLDREWVPGLREGVDLVGQDFVLRRSWNLSQISCALEWPPCNEAVEWLIQRIPVPPDHTGEWSVLEPVAVQQAIIWAYLEQAENDTSYSQ